MVGLKIKDINRESLMILYMCYEYGLNFHDLRALYRVSNKYFWIFIESIAPMLKIGKRKAYLMKTSIDNIVNFLKNLEEPDEVKEEDRDLYHIFSLFIESNFTDGNNLYSVDRMKDIDFRGYGATRVPSIKPDKLFEVTKIEVDNYYDLKRNLDSIRTIKTDKGILYKVCPMAYYIEKFKGDITTKEALRLSTKDMVSMVIENGVIELSTKDKVNKKDKVMVAI